jgi:hypothetical protein
MTSTSLSKAMLYDAKAQHARRQQALLAALAISDQTAQKARNSVPVEERRPWWPPAGRPTSWTAAAHRSTATLRPSRKGTGR